MQGPGQLIHLMFGPYHNWIHLWILKESDVSSAELQTQHKFC